jgi:hypothetical protein
LEKTSVPLRVKNEKTAVFEPFHPDYLFADAPADASSHYTNRSPFPILHLIREESLEAALEKFPNPENIPLRNVKHAEKLGKMFFQKLLSPHASSK